MEDKVSVGFRPREDELVGIHLRRRLEGNANYVHEFISEVDVCSFDPWDLRFQSKYKSTDPMWYFFSPIKNKYRSGDQQNRTTNSGHWKVNSGFKDVIDKWGVPSGFRGKTGAKRVLSFIDGNHGRNPGKTNSDWMMHEYHCTIVPEHQRTHVICRLHYKGDDPSILEAFAMGPDPAFVPNMTSSEGSAVNQSFQGNSGSYNTYPGNDSAHLVQQFNDNFNMQLAPPGNLGSFPQNDSAYLDQVFGVNFDMLQSEDFNHLLEYDIANDDQWLSENELQMIMEQNFGYVVDESTHMQENCSAYRPKKTETGVIADDSSDTETGSMIFEDTSSSTDSVGSSNESDDTSKDEIPSLITKVKNTEKRECEWKMPEDSMKKRPSTKMVKQSWIVMEKISQRNSQWNYLMNMIIGFVVFLSIIGWIILVG